MINAGMLLAGLALVNWEEFVLCQVRANETYSEAKRQFNARNKDVIMNAHAVSS